MLQWISDWLREIIFIVLLAIFIDLLLPNKAMQRYVKVVLSLFILMTILSPIVNIFRADLTFENWDDTIIDVTAYGSLNEVLSEGDRLRLHHEQHAQQMIEGQIAELMRRELEQELPGQIADVKIKAEPNTVEGDLNIEKVYVALVPQMKQQDQQFNDQQDQETLAQMKPIEPVVININLEHINEEHVLSSEGDLEEQEKNQLQTTVSRILEQNWHVSPKQLVVTYVKQMSG